MFKRVRRTNRLQGRKLQFESMESRRLLAADLFHHQGASHQGDHGVSAIVSTTASSQKSVSASTKGTETELVATLNNSTTGATATVEYKSGVEHGVANTELEVHVSRQAANARLSVAIGGVTVGSITTDANGKGQLKLESNPDSTRDLPLPAGFTAAVGTAVQVGSDSGVLAVPSNTNPGKGGSHGDHDKNDHENDHHENDHRENDQHEKGGHEGNEAGETKFVSRLQGTGTQVGTVEFETETHGTTTSSELEISVKNMTPNATLDVTIGGVKVGQITTDATGRGKLELSSTPHGTRELPLPTSMPTIAAGSTVQIGTELSGTFNYPAAATITPTTPATGTTTGTNTGTSTGTKVAPTATATKVQAAVASGGNHQTSHHRRSHH